MTIKKSLLGASLPASSRPLMPMSGMLIVGRLAAGCDALRCNRIGNWEEEAGR
jgi:hypothetical protein